MVFRAVEDTPLGPLVWYFTQNGLDLDFIVETFLEYILAISADIHLFIETELKSLPCSLANWFRPGLSSEQQLALIQEFVDSFLCCCDEGVSVVLLH